LAYIPFRISKNTLMAFYSHLPKNTKFNFHKVVYRQYSGKMRNTYIIMANWFKTPFTKFYRNRPFYRSYDE